MLNYIQYVLINTHVPDMCYNTLFNKNTPLTFYLCTFYFFTSTLFSYTYTNYLKREDALLGSSSSSKNFIYLFIKIIYTR